MENSEGSMDGSVSNGEVSDHNLSEVGSDAGGDINDIDSAKLDASHREILEKLKRQELEERQEIERELKEAQQEAFERARQQEELRAQDLRAQEMRVQDLRTHVDSSEKERHRERLDRDRDRDHIRDKMDKILREHHANHEIRIQRPQGLLAQHGLTKSHSRDLLDREKDRIPLVSDRPLDLYNPAAYLDRFSRQSPPTHPHTPQSDLLSSSPAHHWTFEEQFKQLYELSDDAKRREFLDDLFSFMQKRGTPVNRIPIMAKQTLDLYELFRLVVSKGGLVEVINKKLWREITKGLNLPSSITSAAFTLRTQYMKYLYPYECEKLKLSNPSELQAAIDGNRREGRRPSYGYDYPVPTLVPSTPHMNGGIPLSLHNGRPNSDDDHPSLPSTPTSAAAAAHARSLVERDARAMEAAAKAMEEATKRMEEASRAAVTNNHHHREPSHERKSEEPPLKRQATEEERLMAHIGMPSAHIKITSRSDTGRGDLDSSLVVSMEVNGIMYQGVLFAQHPRRI